MSETTTAIFTELKSISEKVHDIDKRTIKIESSMVHKVDKIKFITAIQKLKDYVDGRLKTCFKENHTGDGLKSSKVDWMKALKNYGLIFAATSGFGAGLATVILKVFG